MSTTIALGNIIGVTEDIFLIRVIPLHRYVNDDAVFLTAEVHDTLVQHGLVFVHVRHKRAYTTVVFKNFLLSRALIEEFDPYSWVKEL